MKDVDAAQDVEAIWQEMELNKLALREAREMVATIDLATARIEFKPDGTILYANPIFCGAMGYTLDDILGQHHRMFMFPEEAEQAAYAEHWQRLAAGERDDLDLAASTQTMLGMR